MHKLEGGVGDGRRVCVCVRGVYLFTVCVFATCAWHVKLQGTADVSCDSICQLVNASRAGRGRTKRGGEAVYKK